MAIGQPSRRQGITEDRRIYALAIEAISQAAMSRDAIGEVLDFERCIKGTMRMSAMNITPPHDHTCLTSLETTCKEASKGSYKTGKGSHDEGVELEGSVLEVRDRCSMSRDEL